MKDREYWDIRAEQVLTEAERNSEEYLAEVMRSLRRAMRDIDGRIRRIFATYRKDFDEEQAKAWLDELIPYTEYLALLAEYQAVQDKTYRRELLMRLNAPAYRFRITRYKFLKQQLAVELAKAADREKSILSTGLEKTLKEAYNRTMYNIQRGTGMAFRFDQIPESTVRRLMNARWYGRNFSASIWRNQQRVADEAARILRAGVLTGKGMDEMARELHEAIPDSGMANATRLIRTEVNYFVNQANLESYKETGIQRYRFIATLDGRTSAVCQAHDWKEYPVAEAAAGENFPPLHPNCRSTTAPVVDVPGLARMGKRAARDADGKTIVVDEMDYGEWVKTVAAL